MSGYRCVNYYDLCRLCTNSTGTRIHIFSVEGKKKNLQQKIIECLPVMVDEKDKLPKILCSTCLQQVEAISEFRNVCLNTQTMLESCVNSNNLQNGGKVYIKDATTRAITVPATQNITVTKDPVIASVTTTQNSDFLNSIIQAVGIQQSSDDSHNMDNRTQTTPQYTVTLDGKLIRTMPAELKIQETPAPAVVQQTDKQIKHNSLAEFLKMKPNIKVTPIPKKKDPQQQQITIPSQIQIQTEPPKPKKPKYNFVVTTPQQQQHQQQQKTAMLQATTPITPTKTVSLQDLKILSPNKCFLPITIKDANSDQQIVAQIDTKNLVLPTTYHLQMKLQPQIATVDGQQIVQLTPTSLPATLSIAPTQTISSQQYQTGQQQLTNAIISSGGIDASTSTNDAEIIFSSGQIQNQVPNSITIQQYSHQPTNVQATQHQQHQQKLQISTIPVTTTAPTAQQIQKQVSSAITVQRVNKQQVGQIKITPTTQITTTPKKPQTQNKIVQSSPTVTKTANQNQQAAANPTAKADTASGATQDCTICGRAFKKKEHLAQHMKLHAGLRPFKCKESGCNKAFSRKEHLMRHIVSHTGKKQFSCDLCQKLFSRKDNLNKHKRTHVEQVGNQNGQFVCEICNKTFVVKMYYIQHKAMHEKGAIKVKAEKSDKAVKEIKKETSTGVSSTSTIQIQQQPQQQQQQIQQQTQQHQIMQLQIATPSSSSMTTQTQQQQTTTAVLKTLGSHDTAVLNLQSNIANLVSLNSGQFMTTGEILGQFKIENEPTDGTS